MDLQRKAEKKRAKEARLRQEKELEDSRKSPLPVDGRRHINVQVKGFLRWLQIETDLDRNISWRTDEPSGGSWCHLPDWSVLRPTSNSQVHTRKDRCWHLHADHAARALRFWHGGQADSRGSRRKMRRAISRRGLRRRRTRKSPRAAAKIPRGFWSFCDQLALSRSSGAKTRGSSYSATRRARKTTYRWTRATNHSATRSPAQRETDGREDRRPCLCSKLPHGCTLDFWHLNNYLLDMIPVVFGKLRDSGYFFDPIKRDIELNFMADLIKKVQGQVNRLNPYFCFQIFSATNPNLLDLSPTNLSAMLSQQGWMNTSNSTTPYIFISSEYILIKNLHINLRLSHFHFWII